MPGNCRVSTGDGERDCGCGAQDEEAKNARVGYIWQHLDRDQVDTPELCSNMLDIYGST
jgi:hypothetical protein